MRSRDAKTSEEGYHALIPMAADHVQDLMDEFSGEKDSAMRSWIAELVGFAKAPAALPFFVQLLDSPEVALRSWARRGLEQLDTKEARTILWQRGLKSDREGSPST